jgi:hypothetical protein
MDDSKQKPNESTGCAPWFVTTGIFFLFLLGAFSWQAKEFGLRNITADSIISSFAASFAFSVVWLIIYVVLKRNS